MAQTYDHERSEKPVWLWLGIGVLLGIGATLLSSSLWLPKNDDVDLVDMDAGEQIVTSSGIASASEAPLSTSPSEEELAPEPAVADVAATINGASPLSPVNGEAGFPSSPDGGGEPETETRLVALDADDAVVPSPINGISQSDAVEQAPEPTAEADQEQAGPAPSEPVTTVERLLPADEVEAEAADAESGTVEAERALAALSRTPETSTEPETGRTEAGRAEASELPDLDTAAPAREPSTPAVAADNEASADDEASRAANSVDIAAVTPAVAPSPPPSSSSGRSAEVNERLYRVQLAAVANEAAAEVYWREVNQRLPGVFADVDPVFNERVVDQRLYLRIWVGSFGQRSEADSYCSWLKEQGQDCFVTRVDNL
jgi:hypothetical protein